MCIRLKAHLPLVRDRQCLMIKWTKPKVRVCSDSVLCLGKMHDNRDAIIRCEGQVEEFKMSASYKELLGIDGETIEFQFTYRIIFMSMFNDIDWTRKRNDGICTSNSEKVKAYAKRFSQGHWTFLGPGDEKEVVRRKMGLHCHSNGGTIQRYKSSSIHEYQ